MLKNKKMPTLEELYAEKKDTQEELRKAKQRKKILDHQIGKLKRNARTHRLCSRGAMLETFLPCPDLLTDDEILGVLQIAFHTDQTENVIERLTKTSEARESRTR